MVMRATGAVFKVPFFGEFINSRDTNCEPLSLTSCSGMPCLAEWALSFLITYTEDVLLRWSKSKHRCNGRKSPYSSFRQTGTGLLRHIARSTKCFLGMTALVLPAGITSRYVILDVSCCDTRPIQTLARSTETTVNS